MMKRLFLALFFLLIAVSLYFGTRSTSVNSSTDTNVQITPTSGDQTRHLEEDETRSATRIMAGSNEEGKLVKPISNTPAPQRPDMATDAFVKKVYSEKWIDAAEGKAGRRRVRVVEADFKYPNVRLEEEVWTDPKTGMQTVRRIRASVADHVMVGLKPGADEKAASELLEQNGYRIRAVEPGSYILAELAEFKADDAQKRSIAEIEGLNEFIDYAEPDYLVYPSIFPNDPAFANRKMWGLDNPGTVAGTTADADIDAPEAWDIRHDASGVIVAVTDTGIQYNHEDLAPNMWTNSSGHYGYDAYDDDNDPMDIGGHGTHCAGTIGARGNNGIGLTGVAWNVQLMGLRFLGPNGGSTSDGIRVVNYAREKGAHIISASWGGGGYSQGLYNAIKAAGDAGIPFVAAAGNDSLNNDATPHYPSSYDLPTIVSVASTTSKDKLSYFSCYGRYSVDIAAPGSDIWSCYIGSNSSYKHLNGTSMATPHVSGALALAKAHYPSEDAEDLIARLYSSVDHIPALAGKVATGGRLNLQKLLGASTAGVNNDDFENALRFEGSYGYWSGSNKKATREDDEDTFSIPNTGDKSVWFAWKAPYRGLVEFTVEASDKQFRVIAFKGSEKGGLTIAADGGSQSLRTDKTIFFYCEQDQEYRFLIDTSQPDGVNLLATLGLKPVNDPITGALGLSGDRFTAKGDNRNATPEAFELSNPHAGVGKGKSLWWKWTPDFDGEFVITTQGSEFDTVLAVYSGAPGSLTEAASNDDRSAFDWTSQVTFEVTSGTTYYIAVDGFRGDASGEILLNGFLTGSIVILNHPESIKSKVGDRVVLDVSIISAGMTKFQWLKDGIPLAGEIQNSLVIDPVENDDFGAYHVKIKNDAQEVDSNTALLTETRTAPNVYWFTGNLAVGTGESVTLSALVRGSSPMTCQWYKDGVIIDGETSLSLNLNSVSQVDSGNYRIQCTNDLGSDFKDIYLGVVDSPWDGWEWRRPGVPNDAITDIKVYGTEIYAVAGEVLFYSTDGVAWSKSKFPDGFSGKSFEMIGDRRICLGYHSDGAVKVAVSLSGADWVVSDPTGLGAWQTGEHLLQKFKGKFIAQLPPSAYTYTSVYYSADGIIWNACQSTMLSSEVTALQGNGRVSTDGNVMIMASATSSSNYKMRYYHTMDGMVWVEAETDAGGEHGSTRFPKQSVYAQGLFHLIGSYSSYTSSDGINWDYHNAASNGIDHEYILVGDATTVYGFKQNDEQKIIWYDEIESRKSRSVYPSNSQTFTAAAVYNGQLLYGTDKGVISNASDPYEVKIPHDRSSDIIRLDFIDDQFVVTPRSPVFGKGAAALLSGDGRTWKYSNSLGSDEFTYLGYALGNYWANSIDNKILKGHTPYDFHIPRDESMGLTTRVRWIGEKNNGDSLAIAATESEPYAIKLQSRVSNSPVWTEVASPPFSVSSSTTFTEIDDRWYSTGTISGFHTSLDGISWQFTGIAGSQAAVTKKDGVVYVVATTGGSLSVSHSVDGVNWTHNTPVGLPTGSATSIKKLMTFNGSLVAHISSKLFFSSDGVVWAKAELPKNVVDAAAGNEQLVIALEGGGLIQAGAIHAGGGAPLVSIASPQSLSSHLEGSFVTVQGEASDPEEGAVTYQCFVDGELVHSGYGTSFKFNYEAGGILGNTVHVRAVDSFGLTQTSTIYVNITSSEPENLLAAGEGLNFLPTDHVAEMGGVYYVAGKKSLYRSVDGSTWDRISMPRLSSPINAMVSGNGALVLQLDNGGIISTRDGINWTYFLPGQIEWRLRTPLRFEGNHFVAAYSNSSISGSVMTSQDGLAWTIGAVSREGYFSWQAIGNDGVVIGIEGSGSGARRSADYGYNWKLIDDLSGASLYNSNGIFADGKYMVIETSVKRVFNSVDAITWSQSDLPSTITQKPSIEYHGGRFFLGGATLLQYSSADSVTWESMNHGIVPTLLTYSQGVYVGVNSGILYHSQDGVSWTEVSGSQSPANIKRVVSKATEFLALDESGAVWRSENGSDWSKSLIGNQSLNLSSQVMPKEMEKIGSNLILAGSANLLHYSEDDGKSWYSALVDEAYPTTASNFIQLKSSGTVALALSSPNSFGNVIRTTNGKDWASVPSLAAVKAVDVGFNGTDWVLVGQTGELYISSDAGISWIEINSGDLKKGAAVAWFNDQWVIVGTTEAAVNSPYHIITRDETGELVDRGEAGFGNSNYPVSKLLAHGKMILWKKDESPRLSLDGITWSSVAVTGLNPGIGIVRDYDIFAKSAGFSILKGSYSTSLDPEMWESDINMSSWSPVDPQYTDIHYADTVDGRIFLFGPKKVLEVSLTEMSMEIDSLNTMSLGVGDELNVAVTLHNKGESLNGETDWKVVAWFSKNAFYGDGNDVYLGEYLLEGSLPEAGESMQKTLSYVLPNNINTGSNYLILKLYKESGVFEKNTANNIVISNTPSITIPEWELTLNSNGNGQINQDLAARRYPQGSRVSLTANSGKGAAFAGWGGDALGAESQITILMDGNKSVQANFNSRASLQVHVRGAGSVSGLADLGSYALDETASLTATPADGWEFSGWSGSATGTNATANILMDSPKVVTAVFTLPKDNWKSEHFTEAELLDELISGDDADPDQDGLKNWQEYLHMSDPRDGTSKGIVSLKVEGDYLFAIFTRNAGAEGGLTLGCQGSRDLTDWDAPDIQERVLSIRDGVETVEARIPVAGGNTGFLRLKYDRAP
ncbi:S8 family serine peptidase [Oceaniferula spumae]